MNQIYKTKKYLFIFGIFFAFLLCSKSASAASSVYHSVSPYETGNLLSGGSPTIVVDASGNATLTLGGATQIDNIGQGVVVEYNSITSYIDSITSATSFHLITSAGANAAEQTSTAVTSIHYEYASLSAAETGLQQDLTSTDLIMNIACYYDPDDYTADTTGATINGWTTDATRYIRIYTPTGGAQSVYSQRHSGVWNDEKYRMLRVNNADVSNYEDYLYLEGLQMSVTTTSVSSDVAIGIWSATALANETYVSNCIVKVNGNAEGSYAYAIRALVSNVVNLNVKNSIFIGSYTASSIGHSGIIGSYAQALIYNSVIYGFHGFGIDGTSNYIVKNSAVFGNGNDFNDVSAIDYCASDDGDGTNAVTPSDWSSVFINYINGDFHLKSTDTDLKDAGTDLSSEGFSTDIDDEARSGTWDIGVDELPTNVYYSVGQSTDDLKTGTPNVTISTGGVGTFTVAQTGNIGVGDRVTFEIGTNHICYISSKTSTTVWNLITATGAVCADHASTDVVSIKHEYTTLSAAEASATDANHLNTTNLVTGNYILNIPCYYDSAADTTAVTINGYTTGENNYIKVYTPNSTTTEANTSQRHSGVWDTSKYRLEVTNAVCFRNDDDYVRVDGLQINNISTTSGSSRRAVTNYADSTGGYSEMHISNNIIKGEYSGTTSAGGGISAAPDVSDDNNVTKIWNNIIYDMNFSTVTMYGIFLGNGKGIIYNNTIFDSYCGLSTGSSADTEYIKNNNIQCNIANASFIDYSFVSGGTYGNNISSDATSPDAAYRNLTVTFADSANDDFHLSSTDTAAKNDGTDLSADANLSFTDDIDGEARGIDWSIGADEPYGAEVQSSNLGQQSLTDGLVLYQPFDGSDIIGTTSFDRSGNSNNGTISGATKTLGKKGQALNFDGVDDEVSAGNCGMDGDSTWTISGWINPTAGDTSEGHFIDNYPLQSYIYNSTFYFYCGDSATHASFPYGAWTFVTLVADGSGHHLYVNGAYSSSGAQTCAISSGDTEIGRYYGGGNYFFNGKIDEVRVYNRVLSSTEITSLYKLGQEKINMSLTDKSTTGLVGMWSFDGADISGVTAYDRSGNGNNGTISGATQAMGKKGQALSFDGSNDYVNAGSGATLDDIETQGGGGMTVSAWVYAESYGESNAGIIAAKNEQTGAVSGSWSFRYTTDNRLVFLKDYATTDLRVISIANSAPYNVWQFVTLTWNGSSTAATDVDIYINGSEVSHASDQNGDGAKNSDIANDLYIGNNVSGSATFDGNIDEVRIYNRVLSEDEISDLYNLGKARVKN